jgi:predicted small lipoprotein YifL
MKRLFFLLSIAAALAGCGDNSAPQQLPDGGVDAPTDAAKLAPCLVKPTDLERPPAAAGGAMGPLPCELLPPGFVAP